MSEGGSASIAIAASVSAIVGLALAISSRIALGEEIFVWDTVVLSQYLLTSITTSIVGPAIIFIHRLHIKEQENKYGVFSMNWPNSKAKLTEIGPIRAKIAYSLRNLIEGISAREIEAKSEIVANQIVHWTINEQEANIRDFGRIQLISRTPGLQGSDESKDTYQLITEFAKPGDEIFATAFTNTRLWWLRPQTGQKFFNFNLDLIDRGLTIKRIFGVNHPDWPEYNLEEDEKGTKKNLIQLHADINQTETYTIEYNSFNNTKLRSRHQIEMRDCLILVRNGVPCFGLEWSIDVFGEADKVYVVFGESQLKFLKENFLAILELDDEDGLNKITSKESLDTTVSENRKKAIKRLKNIENG
mgnify:CR=1 FL=1